MSISSPLQLERCTLSQLSIKTRTQGTVENNDETKADVKLTYNVRRHRSELRFWIPFQLSIAWPDSVDSTFEEIEIGLDGIFVLPVDTPEEAVQHYVPLLCLTNLYGIARGILAQSTGMCLGGPYMLSLVDMEQILKGNAKPEMPVKPQHDPAFAESTTKTKTVRMRF